MDKISINSILLLDSPLGHTDHVKEHTTNFSSRTSQLISSPPPGACANAHTGFTAWHLKSLSLTPCAELLLNSAEILEIQQNVNQEKLLVKVQLLLRGMFFNFFRNWQDFEVQGTF